MTERPSRAVDLHGFALREFLEFVRKEDPTWLEGAQVRRSDDGHQRSGLVEGKVWVEGNSPTSTRGRHLLGSDVDEVTKQFEADSPLVAIAVERGGALVDAHDQADAVLQVLVGEGHPVSDAEVGPAWNLRWWARPGEFHVCRCRTAFS